MFMSLAGLYTIMMRARIRLEIAATKGQDCYLFRDTPNSKGNICFFMSRIGCFTNLASCNHIGALSHLATAPSFIYIVFILNKADVYTIMDFLQSPESPSPWAQCRQITASLSGVRHLRAVYTTRVEKLISWLRLQVIIADHLTPRTPTTTRDPETPVRSRTNILCFHLCNLYFPFQFKYTFRTCRHLSLE